MMASLFDWFNVLPIPANSSNTENRGPKFILEQVEYDFVYEATDGREIIVVASDGTYHQIHSRTVKRLFLAKMERNEHIRYGTGGYYYLDLEGPTIDALFQFLRTPERASINGKSYHITVKLVEIATKYSFTDLLNATTEELSENIEAGKWTDMEPLWVIHSWIVRQTDQQSGDIPEDLLPLKSLITKAMRKLLPKTRNQKVRSPAGKVNMLENYWTLNVNFML